MSHVPIGGWSRPITNNPEDAGGCCVCVLLPAAIAAIVIASNYDQETSACVGEFVVDLQIFLQIAGYFQLVYGILHICLMCCGTNCDQETKKKFNRAINGPNCCLGIFYLVWAGIGLYMYSNQMTTECQKEAIGTMIFAWSLIQYIIFAIVLFCCGCIICFVGTAAIISSQDPNVSVSEQEELVSDGV